MEQSKTNVLNFANDLQAIVNENEKSKQRILELETQLKASNERYADLTKKIVKLLDSFGLIKHSDDHRSPLANIVQTYTIINPLTVDAKVEIKSSNKPRFMLNIFTNPCYKEIQCPKSGFISYIEAGHIAYFFSPEEEIIIYSIRNKYHFQLFSSFDGATYIMSSSELSMRVDLAFKKCETCFILQGGNEVIELLTKRLSE